MNNIGQATPELSDRVSMSATKWWQNALSFGNYFNFRSFNKKIISIWIQWTGMCVWMLELKAKVSVKLETFYCAVEMLL